MAGDNELFAAAALSGIADGITKGLAIKMQRQQQDRAFEMQNKQLDLAEKRAMRQEAQSRESTKRADQIFQANLLEKGLRLNNDSGKVEAIPTNELPARQAEEMRRRQSKEAREARIAQLDEQLKKAKINLTDAQAQKSLRTAINSPKAKAKDFKVNQIRAGGFAQRAELAEDQLKKFLASNPAIKPESASKGFFDLIPDFAEALKPDDVKTIDAIQNAFITASLRQESGAAIPPEEVEQKKRELFPLPGDSEEIIKNKATVRRQVIENLKSEAGGAMELFPQVAQAEGSTTSPKDKPSQEAKPKAQKLSPEKIQVLKKALLNKDPRSEQIKKLLKSQGAL